MNGDYHMVDLPSPMHLIDRAPRQQKHCAGGRCETKTSAPGFYLIYAGSAHHHVKEMLRMLMIVY